MNQSHKLPSFEGLRGIAAFVVVLHHLHLAFYATSNPSLPASLWFLPDAAARPLLAFTEGLYNGNFAVWLFWIMSAFVLSLQFFLRAREPQLHGAHDYLEDACLRRYPRLLIPVAACVAFAYTLMALGLMQNQPLAAQLGDAGQKWLAIWYNFPPSLPEAFKLAVWHAFFAYGIGFHSYNNVLWTMQPEFYGSLFLFAFLALCGSRGSRFFLYPLIAFVNFRLDIYWLNAFVAGIALCDVFVNGKTPASALNFIRQSRLFAVVLWVLLLVRAGFPDYLGVSWMLTAVAAVSLTLISRPTQWLLSRRMPVFLGKISFGLYLIHVPIICSFSSWAYLAARDSFGPDATPLLVSAGTCVLSVALAYVFYVYVDQPALWLSRWLSHRVINPDRHSLDAEPLQAIH